MQFSIGNMTLCGVIIILNVDMHTAYQEMKRGTSFLGAIHPQSMFIYMVAQQGL